MQGKARDLTQQAGDKRSGLRLSFNSTRLTERQFLHWNHYDELALSQVSFT